MEDRDSLHPARGETGRDRYDPLSRALHWATAVLVLASFALGIWPGMAKGSAALHKSLGLLLLFIVPMRLGWRLFAGWGGARPGSAGAGAFAAKAVHGLLYAMLLAVPLLGWLHLNSKGIGAAMFGVPMPMLADTDRQLAAALLRAKWWLSYGMLAAIGLHAAAALAHHYLLRDGVLASMMPSGFGRGRVAKSGSPTPGGINGAAGANKSA